MARSRLAAGARFGRRKRLKSRAGACVPSDLTQAVAAMSMGNFRRYRARDQSVKHLKMQSYFVFAARVSERREKHCAG